MAYEDSCTHLRIVNEQATSSMSIEFRPDLSQNHKDLQMTSNPLVAFRAIMEILTSSLQQRGATSGKFGYINSRIGAGMREAYIAGYENFLQTLLGP